MVMPYNQTFYQQESVFLHPGGMRIGQWPILFPPGRRNTDSCWQSIWYRALPFTEKKSSQLVDPVNWFKQKFEFTAMGMGISMNGNVCLCFVSNRITTTTLCFYIFVASSVKTCAGIFIDLCIIMWIVCFHFFTSTLSWMKYYIDLCQIDNRAPDPCLIRWWRIIV